MAYNDWVDWRLAHGSECSFCPLNGQRKVGCIGDPDAGPIIVLEAPGAEEEGYNKEHQKYGVPIVGRSGWALKHKLLAPVGFVDVEKKEGQWPKVKKWNTFVMNTIMCRPPDNKINSPEGKKAVACCSNSAKALLELLLKQNPDRTLIPLGGTALALMTGQASIGPCRGRVMNLKPSSLQPLPQEQLLKIVARGYKPPEYMVQPLAVLKGLLSKQRTAWQTLPEREEKARLAREKKEAKAASRQLEKELKDQIKPYLTLLNAVLTKQRKSLSQVKSA